MMKSFRFAAAAMLLALLMLVSAACAPGAASESDKASTGMAAGDAKKEQAELTVSAAVSLTDALSEIQTLYESTHAGVRLHFNFGGSGALQKQLEQGAPADLFFSAAVSPMEQLVRKQIVNANDQISLLTNELAVIVPSDSKTVVQSGAGLLQDGLRTVAIGIPESVPAGSYAKEALTNAGLWDRLQPKLVQAKDVRQVLQYVATGNADAGMVYKTDAMTTTDVKIAYIIDPSTHTPIEYPLGMVAATKHREEAERFYRYLQTEEALNIFEKYGFSIPPSS
ncbi:molybdate ABC transporter substrate-binding protein [Paenibacillus melissococcoides]|uniref:Molybdate ABC transporter substrate-binding protein n=1 Tax=Paenibacillus melissococcoides TaxID=2912268 RepID=A0ABN8U6H4_9BACL|nr:MULTISPECIES: molybdate ABC transporter substrate-binding protein [Paenibacillus]MEB9892122.1 molybdate ABC transporter substrate-binding protein [Bacillus cereus]CAH8246732.1 molybdate ABC transporter substrate-binding protein [Paenibacillus melissococcoides]CAH8715589.1 molybdate ABC transporter substrate-binding protein [Paenibacillus melissococcoides]CAH8716548.1 molybdate ABC transporter substrate-binding protein [Paenibacillus melissococcoides]GIO77086.1 molybdate ABC transporter subs